MNRLVVACVVAGCALGVQAMPTRAELASAQSMIDELMAPAIEDFRNADEDGKASAAVKVADACVKFAKSAETEPVKFLLLKGAVRFYVRGQMYDKAADTVGEITSSVKNVPPSVVVEIVGKAVDNAPKGKATRLVALARQARIQSQAAENLKTLSSKMKKVKTEVDLLRYAEAFAILGEWKKAYVEFAKCSDAKLKAVVAAESSGKVKNQVAGDFWWKYIPATDGADCFFRNHAAVFYKKALATGEIPGLKKNIVEQRLSSLVADGDESGNEVVQDDEASDVAEVKNSHGDDMNCYEDSDSEVIYEIRVSDVIRDGGAEWMWTDRNPGMEMDKFSSPGSKIGNMSKGKSPLGRRNLWGRVYEGTKWFGGRTEYWVRREFDLKTDISKVSGGYLVAKFDHDCEIWLNGEEVYSSGDVSWLYHKVTLAASSFRAGKNVIAAHVQCGKGDGWLDFGLVALGNGLSGIAKSYTSAVAPYVRVSMDSIAAEKGLVRAGIHGGDEWAYSFIKPASIWKKFEFDDQLWKRGNGGFGGGPQLGLREYSNLRKSVQTRWEGDHIWMRRKFSFNGKASDVKSALICLRGYGLKVYINGIQVATEMDIGRCSMFEGDFWDAYDITGQFKKLVKTGDKNIIAVEAHQEGGRNLTYWSRCADIGLYVDAAVPMGAVANVAVEKTKTGSMLSGIQSEDSMVLDASKSPYLIEGQYVVPAGKSLTVKEGVTLIFRRGAGMLVDGGAFSVEGTVARPVVFRGELKPAGSWKGVVVRSAPNLAIEGAVFTGAECGLKVERMDSAIVQSSTFCGNTVGMGGLISRTKVTDCFLSKNVKDGYCGGDQGCAIFEHCTIADNGGWGVEGPFKFAAGMVACEVRNNREGGYYTGRMGSYSVKPQLITGCSFESNGAVDVKIGNTLTWPCTGNWWGAATTRELTAKGVGAFCKRIIDARHDSGLGVVDLSDFLVKPPKDCGARNYPKF